MSKDAVVYQVTRLPRNPEERPLVLAITSKTSAQRLVAALAEQEGQPDGYKITAFTHPEFPFMRGDGPVKAGVCGDAARAENLVLFGRWERGELTDHQLVKAMKAMRARQGRLRERSIAPERDGRLKEERGRC
jgi:hypothetical protein